MNLLRLIFKNPRHLVWWLAAADWLTMVGAFGVGLYFRRYDPDMNIIRLRELYVVPEVSLVMVYATGMLLIFRAQGLYLRKTWLSNWYHAFSIFESATWMVLGYFLLRGTTKLPFLVPSRRVIFYWYGLTIVGLLLHRMVVFPWLAARALKKGLRRKVVLIGDTDVASHLLSRQRHGHGFAMIEPIGLIADHPQGVVRGLPRLGGIADLAWIAREYGVEGAILCNPDLTYDQLMHLIEECIRLFGWVDVHTEKAAVWHRRPNTDHYFDIPFARLAAPTHSPAYRWFKRTLDVAVSSLALILLAPFLALIALLIKLTSPGPVFYARERIGRDGRPFKFYKFRSMRVGADQDEQRRAAILAHIKQGQAGGKIVNPAMVTPVGRFIRKWGIDEIPQLWNVLKGEMTLVGPRPLPPEEYEAQEPWQKKRFSHMTPGCTGLWKVMVARYGNITFADTALYDLYYARNMNPLLDLYILVQTAWVILRGRADAR